jgi:hypothetical protein
MRRPDDRVSEALRLAGWTSDRHVSITDELAALEGQGHPVFPVLVEFLESYSGLSLAVDHDDRQDAIRFSAARACAGIGTAWVLDYSARERVRLAPVGECYRQHLTLLLGEDGRVYGGYDNEFGRMGDTVLAALANLIDHCGFLERL